MKLRILPALTGLLVLPGLSSGGVIYFDNTFSNSNYSTAFTYTYEGSGTIGAIGPAQCATCGEGGGDGLSTTFFIAGSETDTDMEIGYLNNGFVYDPSTSGAITSLFVSADNDTTITLNGLSIEDIFEPLIEQDGNYYVYTGLFTTSNGDFQTLSGTLSASDFAQFNPTTGASNPSSNPNFSGDPITFGLVIQGGSIALPGNNQTSVYNNLEFAVNAPEPATLPLIGAALAGLALLRQRFLRG